jgi:hypothetical protein
MYLLHDLYVLYPLNDVQYKSDKQKSRGQACSTFPGVALHHLAVRLEALLSDHVDGQLLVIRLLSGHHGSVGGEGVVDPGAWVVQFSWLGCCTVYMCPL